MTPDHYCLCFSSFFFCLHHSHVSVRQNSLWRSLGHLASHPVCFSLAPWLFLPQNVPIIVPFSPSGCHSVQLYAFMMVLCSCFVTHFTTKVVRRAHNMAPGLSQKVHSHNPRNCLKLEVMHAYLKGQSAPKIKHSLVIFPAAASFIYSVF